jgi:hypothetical protein
MDKKTFQKELKNRLRFTLQYEIGAYSKEFHQQLIEGIKKRIDNEQLTLIISSFKKEKKKCIYKFYIEISAKGASNLETFDIPGVANSNLKYIEKKNKWLIIDQMIEEDLYLYSEPKLILNSQTNKRLSLDEHITYLLLLKGDNLLNIGLTLLGLYPDEWLEEEDILERLSGQIIEKLK